MLLLVLLGHQLATNTTPVVELVAHYIVETKLGQLYAVMAKRATLGVGFSTIYFQFFLH